MVYGETEHSGRDREDVREERGPPHHRQEQGKTDRKRQDTRNNFPAHVPTVYFLSEAPSPNAYPHQ